MRQFCLEKELTLTPVVYPDTRFFRLPERLKTENLAGGPAGINGTTVSQQNGKQN